MLWRLLTISLALLLAACAAPSRVPPFAAKPYEPFARANAVAIAMREWRLFGSLIDDPALQGWKAGSPLEKPERLTHVPITGRGTLGDPGEPVLDRRYRWFVVLEVLYDAEAEPARDE